MSKKEQKVKLKINTDNFSNFVDKLSIVSSINDTVMVKIDKDDILMYSMISGGSMILAFKNFTLKTEDIFTNEIDYKMNLIIPNCKKFVKNLSFIKELDKIDFELNCREEDELMSVRSFKISSGKFKVTWMGGDSSSIRDINKTNLDRLLDINNKKWSFNIDNSDFIDIKKLSSINFSISFSFLLDVLISSCILQLPILSSSSFLTSIISKFISFTFSNIEFSSISSNDKYIEFPK